MTSCDLEVEDGLEEVSISTETMGSARLGIRGSVFWGTGEHLAVILGGGMVAGLRTGGLGNGEDTGTICIGGSGTLQHEYYQD